uniref:hypothetical protein n=1 Tax=Sphingomonas sp. AR_OL41 TaxID=3042729 RepID=UPI0024814305|nr:hypothetical protein [Sphingomonas sp. AR_OL41]
MRDVLAARERVRQSQQGFGRPIMSAKVEGHQVVAVGSQLHWSSTWKTFPDFLGDYLKKKLGRDWGNTEIAKPLAERHTVMQWYDALCRHQKKTIATPGQPSQVDVIGVIACYFTVAYGLYLLEHNVELQARLLARIKDPGNFQGAYYELIVASAFILAGFKLTLEDEADGNNKHCEFAAVSPHSGKTYWIEAKMRGVAGELGRTSADGTSSSNPLSSMVKQLNAALAKPAEDDRMIFLDLNATMAPNVDNDNNRPPFIAAAAKRLRAFEQKELKQGEKAYVFVTTASYHKDLDAPAQLAALPFGLGMPDFNRPGSFRLSERYLADKRHADALHVAESFGRLLSFPSTFDGSLPSVSLHGEPPPVTIGATYNFEKAGPDGEDIVGTVTSATVMEAEKEVVVAINAAGTSFLAKEPMSDQQLADYKAHPDAYFGKVVRPSGRADTPAGLFDFLMEGFSKLTREQLLEKLQGRVPAAETLDLDHLRAIYAEGMVSASGVFEVVDGVTVPRSPHQATPCAD